MRGFMPEIGNLTIKLMEAWNNAPLEAATLTIVIVGHTVTRYGRIEIKDNVVVITMPAETHVLVTAEADGYLTSTVSFFVHHRTGMCHFVCLSYFIDVFVPCSAENILPVHLRRQSSSLSVQYVPGNDHNVSLHGVNSVLTLRMPDGALNVSSHSQLSVTVSPVDLTASVLGVPQLFGVTREMFDESDRINLDALSAVHVDITDDRAESVDLLTPIYLHIPFSVNQSVIAQLSTWWHDDILGLWRRVGFAVVKEEMLELNISQLGWWAAAIEWTDTSCVTTRITHSSSSSTPTPLTGSVVSLTGDNYSYSSTRGTDLAGLACVEQKTYGRSVLQVVNERVGVDSGPINMTSSNHSDCPDGQRWLTTSGTLAGCSWLDILCKCDNYCVAVMATIK